MSSDESLLARLGEAIQEAARLNEKGRAGLEKALGAAIGYGPVEGNYRYAFAKRMLLDVRSSEEHHHALLPHPSKRAAKSEPISWA